MRSRFSVWLACVCDGIRQWFQVCRHHATVREVADDGRLRLRCVTCWRVSPGWAVGPPAYRRTQPAAQRKLKGTRLRIVKH